MTGGDPIHEAGDLAEQAEAALAAGQLARAKELGQRALDLRRRLLGEDDLKVADSFRTMARLMIREEKLAGADLIYQQAMLDTFRTELGSLPR